jgi:hypothetical protein
MIRISIFFVFLILSSHVYAQIHSDFESGNLDYWQQSTPNTWAASAESPINGNFSLRHTYDNPLAGNDQISYAYTKIIDYSDTAIWELE